MSYRIMLIINAIVVVVFGVFLLIVPQTALTQFGTEVYVATLFLARFLGGTLLISGLLLWFLKDVFDQKTQKSIEITLLGGSVGGFVLSLIGMTTSGVVRTNGWILLVISVVFGLGYAFLLFLQPQMSNSGAYQKQV